MFYIKKGIIKKLLIFFVTTNIGYIAISLIKRGVLYGQNLETLIIINLVQLIVFLIVGVKLKKKE